MPLRMMYSKKITCPDFKDNGHKHVVFRKTFELFNYESAKAFIVSDGYCELYLNGFPVSIVPGDSICRRIDATDYLMQGENVLALHTRFESVSDGMRFELEIDGKRTVYSDESFLCAVHDGYMIEHDIDREIEIFDSRSEFVSFESPYYSACEWIAACSQSDGEKPVDTISITDTVPKKPASVKELGNVYSVAFDGNTAGSLFLAAKGRSGTEVRIATDSGFCVKWILSGEDDMLDLFRVEKIKTLTVRLPQGAKLEKDDIRLRIPAK